MANNISILVEAKDNASAALSKVGNEVNNFADKAEDASGKTERFGGSLSRFGNILATTAQAFIGYQIVQGVENLATSFITAAGGLEQTNISFQNLIGNTQQANKLFGDLVQYANTTPFESKDVEDAAKQLLAFGQTADQVTDTVKKLGDVTAAGGGDLQALSLVTGQIFAQGKLRAQDMYQVINDGGAGLIKIMADGAGGMQKLTAEFDSGGIPAQQYFDAINKATAQGGFAFDGAQKQAQTLNGRLSTLKDSATQFGEALLGVRTDPELGLSIQPGGLFDRMSNLVQAASVHLQALGPIAGEAMSRLISGIGEAVRGFSSFVAGLVNWDRVSNDLSQVMGGLRDVVADRVMPVLHEFADWFVNLPPVVQAATLPIAAFALHLHDMSTFARSVIDNVKQLWNAFTQSTPVIIVGQFFTQVFIPALAAIWAAIVQNLLPALSQLWSSIVRLWNSLNPGLGEALKIVGGLLGDLLLAAIWAVLAALNLVIQAISMAISLISDLVNWISNIIGWFGNLIGVAVNAGVAIVSVFRNILPAARDVALTIPTFFADLGGMILSAIGDLGSLLYNTGKSMITGLIKGIKDGISSIGSGIVSGVDSVLHAAHIPGFATGGYTGTGPSDEVAGVVHRGEYVLPKSMVDQSTGLPMAGAAGSRTVHIENLNTYNNVDVNAVIRKIGFQLATA